MEIVPEQEPSLHVVSSRGIVAMEDDSDHKVHVVVRAGQLQSSGDPKDDLGGVKRTLSSASTDTLCGKFFRKLKISSSRGRSRAIPQNSSTPTQNHPQNSPTPAQNHPQNSPTPAQNHPGKGRGKRIHWDLRNIFTHSKQRHHHRSSGHHENSSLSTHSKQRHQQTSSGHHEDSSSRHKKSSGRSTNPPEYRLVRDPEFPRYYTVPPQDERLKLLWRLTDSELRHHANISMIVEAPQEIEESIPLLGYPEALIKPHGNGAGHPGKAIAQPWILRKWRIKDSKKLLKIYPNKEILFHHVVNETYSSSITLQNRTKGYVAFKFKSTCPNVFTMTPKYGVLGPNLAITVDAFRHGDPFLPSGRQKDLFVVMTVPVPESMIINNAVSSFVFRRFPDRCRCEGVLRAIYSLPEIVPVREMRSFEAEVDEQVRMDALYRSLTLSRLTSIPETETGH